MKTLLRERERESKRGVMGFCLFVDLLVFSQSLSLSIEDQRIISGSSLANKYRHTVKLFFGVSVSTAVDRREKEI